MRRKQVYPALFLLLFLASTVSWAVPQPLGTELKISSCDTCKKRSPAVAGIAIGAQAGVFLVAWESTSLTDPAGVSARFFLKTALPRATDLLVNRDAAPQQRGAVAAVDAQGNSVVAWAVSNGLNSDIMVQRYKPTGLANGAAFQVNTRPANVTTLDVAPAVAFAPNGSFVVAWTRSVPASATSPGATPVVMARLFKAAGTPLAPQVQLSTGLATGARPDVCVDTLGRAVVVWTIVDEYRPFEPSNFGVTARRIATNGAPLGGEILVAAPLAASSTAAVACGTGGQFVVAWSSNQAPATDGSDVLARRFTTE